MNEIKVRNRFKLAVKRALAGDISGQDLKAIVEYQLREYVGEEQDPFTDVELALMTHHMITFN
jgi:hypothetical protein